MIKVIEELGLIWYIKHPKDPKDNNDLKHLIFTLAVNLMERARNSGTINCNHFGLKNDDEKWSRIFYFEIQQAPLELLLPSTNKSAQNR